MNALPFFALGAFFSLAGVVVAHGGTPVHKNPGSEECRTFSKSYAEADLFVQPPSGPGYTPQIRLRASDGSPQLPKIRYVVIRNSLGTSGIKFWPNGLGSGTQYLVAAGRTVSFNITPTTVVMIQQALFQQDTGGITVDVGNCPGDTVNTLAPNQS